MKILTSKQMFRTLPITLSRVKADNTSENLLNETCQTLYSLYRAKESIQQCNEFNKVIKQNGYYIYEI